MKSPQNITPERVAINVRDAKIADNEGNRPADEIIKPDGANAYFSNLPIKAIVQKLQEHKIPAAVSNSAGTYVCNDVMYQLLYLLNKRELDIRGGLIHVPYELAQVIGKPESTPAMSLADISEGLRLAIVAVIENQ